MLSENALLGGGASVMRAGKRRLLSEPNKRQQNATVRQLKRHNSATERKSMMHI
jgi:hypothetical protein